MIINSTMISEAARETEMLRASSPSPTNSTAYYVIVPGKDRGESIVKLITHSTEPPNASKHFDRRKNGSDARPDGASFPLPASLASLPFSSFFVDPVMESVAKPISGWRTLFSILFALLASAALSIAYASPTQFKNNHAHAPHISANNNENVLTPVFSLSDREPEGSFKFPRRRVRCGTGSSDIAECENEMLAPFEIFEFLE